MESSEQLRRRLQTTKELQSVVKTMKTLASVSIRQYQKAMEALRGYSRVVDLGLQAATLGLPLLPACGRQRPEGVEGALVVGTDQGMVGSLNEKVVSLALETLRTETKPGEPPRILVCGQRALALLEEAGREVEACLPLPGSAGGIVRVVQEILLHLEGWQLGSGEKTALVFYNAPTSGSSYQPRRRRLAAIDDAWPDRVGTHPWPNRAIPTYTMDRRSLVSALIRQRVAITLFRSLAEALASEHASRLAAMHSAEKNIGERLKELGASYHQQRQKAIDEELMDISAGFEALRGL